MRRPRDTTIDARRRQVDAYRAMRPETRLRLAAEMSAPVGSLADAGRRARAARQPPELDDQPPELDDRHQRSDNR